MARPSYAGVSVSDVRIPLMWKRKDHLNDSGDRRRFAVFCLARIGAQIYDSSLICPVDRWVVFCFFHPIAKFVSFLKAELESKSIIDSSLICQVDRWVWISQNLEDFGYKIDYRI